MKKSLVLLAALLMTVVGYSQSNAPTFIKGTLNIKYDSRAQPGVKGVLDIYQLDVNVNNSARFYGKIAQTPIVIGGILSSVQQSASIAYDLQADVINPANPAQSRNVGRLSGMVPIDEQGVYKFSDGTMRIAVEGVGTAQGFQSRFTGRASGKPLVRSDGWLDKLKREAINITRSVNGKTVSISVKKYDKMTFENHVLAKGPVPIYPEVTVTGDMIYDYSRYVWYFQNLQVVYSVDGKQMADRLTGNIRWVESPNRKANGEGEYQFDVRVNEPPPSESAVFAAASDESAFFTVDTQQSSLTGTMKYKDTMRGDTVTASAVVIDLQGNRLTKQQAMYLCKLLMLSSIVPMNAE